MKIQVTLLKLKIESILIHLFQKKKKNYIVFYEFIFYKRKFFIISSSYENINSIFNNIYINDFKLQKKIKNIIIFELNNKESDKSITKKSYNNQYLQVYLIFL